MADLEVSYEDGIATLTMNRPKARNALSMEMRSALADVLHDIEQDSSVRVSSCRVPDSISWPAETSKEWGSL